MRVLLSGASGLVGRALEHALVASGDTVSRLVRPGAEPRPGDVAWDPATGRLDAAAAGGADAIVHLAGESMGAGRWTKRLRERVWQSRVEATEKLSKSLVALAAPPRVMVCASAVGIYGDRGDELLTERSDPGTGFLAELCVAWEKATEPFRHHALRCVSARLGIVLDRERGALARMLPVFRAGVGGRLGDGRQWWSWIDLEDAVAAFVHVLRDTTVAGPVNLVAGAVPNAEFTATLGRVLDRRAFFAVPALALRMAMGDGVRELVLSSQRVAPAVLSAKGFRFIYPELEPALRHVLGV